MGRFIDETAAQKCLAELMERRGVKSWLKTAFDANDFEQLLAYTPTVEDAVEVVRCGNCKHWGTGCAGETDRIKECEYAHYMTGANGYCVYGERREDDA